MTTFNFTNDDYVSNNDFSFNSYSYKILSGASLNYNAIWADPNANVNSGRFYIATTGSGAALSVVDLQRNIVVDAYSMSIKGAGNEFLDKEDVVDINITNMGI
jgi:hypothetical protein